MNWADFHFIRPYFLLALIPALALMFVSVKNTLAKGEWADVCDAALLPFILEDKQSSKSYWVVGALSMAVLLSIVALAGPTWERLETPAFRNDAALVIALDLSQTMNATDIKPSRLVRARYKIADILRQRKDGLTALVVYSADAFTVTPLTSDAATIENQLNALESSLMPRQGKDTQAALTLAVNLLQQAGQKQGNIFLITDGIKQPAKTLEKELGDYVVSILGV
ncbi:MAG: VWA domain-containing protein, partial [Cycloclasticus pugetii]